MITWVTLPDLHHMKSLRNIQLEGNQLSANNFYKQYLKVLDKTPVYIKNYRLPQYQLEEIYQHWAINFFRSYLYGKRFIVVTDNRPLVSLFTYKNRSSKLTRIQLDLCDCDADMARMQTTMIPTCDDETVSKKMLPITRSMKPKEKIITDESQKSHELHIWDCTPYRYDHRIILYYII